MTSLEEHVLDLLLRADRSARADVICGDARAVRVGRNDVWKLACHEAEHECLFAKFWASPADYDREVIGLRLAGEMAQEDATFMAADLVLADKARGVVVTRQIPGRSFAEVVKAAYRIDRNPFRRQEAIAAATEALTRILRWLQTLHQRCVSPAESLRDHSLGNICGHIEKKLELFSSRNSPIPPKLLEAAKSLYVSLDATIDSGQPTALMFGDVSFGNFFVDGMRVGAIDFEDLGYGVMGQDEFTLDWWMAEASRRWKYWQCRELRNLVDISGVHGRRASLYMLKYALDRFPAPCLKGRPRASKDAMASLLYVLNRECHQGFVSTQQAIRGVSV